jgi:NAD(P)-dependent dehydrogenase (short-subunit alcohol dehydrogenase family)
MDNTTERIVLITGANRGIGFETAQQLARRDFHVIAARDQASGQQAAGAIQSANGLATFLPLDVSSADSIQSVAKQFAAIADHNVICPSHFWYSSNGSLSGRDSVRIRQRHSSLAGPQFERSHPRAWERRGRSGPAATSRKRPRRWQHCAAPYWRPSVYPELVVQVS